MAGSEYSFEGFDALEQQLTRMIEQEFPAEFERMVVQIAFELQGRVKERTPHVTGRLQDSWKVGKIKRIGDEYVIEVYTNIEYAEPVEYGHRTSGGGFVPGRHMMELSLQEVADYLPSYLQNWLRDFLESHEL